MTMPKEFYRIGSYSVDHTTYGGHICQSDFDTEYCRKQDTNGSKVAAKIISDWRFDESCKKRNETRIHNNNWIKSKNNN